jgi:hypothetical protein
VWIGSNLRIPLRLETGEVKPFSGAKVGQSRAGTTFGCWEKLILTKVQSFSSDLSSGNVLVTPFARERSTATNKKPAPVRINRSFVFFFIVIASTTLNHSSLAAVQTRKPAKHRGALA